MKIDWIEGTIKEQNRLDDLERLLGEMQKLNHGMLGYEHSASIYISGRIAWSETHINRGIHVSLPSSAITNSGLDPLKLLYDLKKLGMKFTRIDIAADDVIKCILDMNKIYTAYREKSYTSRLRQVKYMESSKNKVTGETIYFGSPTSDTRIRIYDKAAERQAAGESFIGHWIRVEIQCRDERADAVANYIIDNPNTWQLWAAGYIKGYLDFKETDDGDSNKRRWKTAQWWDEFLDHASKERLTISRGIRTIEDLQAWFDRQVGPSLCTAQTVYGAKRFSQIIQSYSNRLKPKHLEIIQMALREREIM